MTNKLIIHLADEEMVKNVIPTYFLCGSSFAHNVSWMSVSAYLRWSAKGNWEGKKLICPYCLASEDFDLMLLKYLP